MEKEWLDGYKVCKRKGNRLISCFIGRGRGRNRRDWKIYGIGHVTKRTLGNIEGTVTNLKKYGPLAVFGYVKDAIRYMGHEPGLALFRCRYTRSTDCELWLPGYRSRRFQRFGPVPGTRFADEVVLIEEVLPIEVT